ncbi:MAG: XRE family transcriptional regulator [Thermodesulfovibrionales bacterium]|nr:XRE family transcriptional regulator [Thermodesulfovibrionales bacterium]
MENLGKRLKYYREQIGLSQIDLSEKSGISQASIARIESGKQKNLKRETMKRLADGLGISLTQLMEPLMVVSEEEAAYGLARAVPVINIKDIDVMKWPGDSARKAETFEASLSSDRNAFYLKVTADITVRPVIEEGDLLLIEPAAEIGEGDMVLFLSAEKKCLGRIFYPYDNLLIQPLDQDLPPTMRRKKEKGRRSVRILRVSGIKK